MRAGLSRAKAAALLEITDGGLKNIERGIRASEELLVKMAKAYGVSEIATRRAYVASRREFLVREKP